MQLRKTLLVVDSGPDWKDFIFSELTSLPHNIYLITDHDPPGSVFSFVSQQNIIRCSSSSSLDMIASLEQLKTKGFVFNGVCTFSEDYVCQTAHIAEYFGLPGLPTQSAMHSSCNKHLMRSVCTTRHVRIPKYTMFSTLSDGIRCYRSFASAVVLKPVNRLGSFGVIKINKSKGVDAFLEAYRKSRAMLQLGNDERQAYLLEEYISGSMVSVDGVIDDNEIYIAGLSTIEMGEEPYFFQKTCYIPGILQKRTRGQCEEFTKDVIHKLGFRNCAFHCELKVRENSDEIYLIEIAARAPGALLPIQYKEAYGINLISLTAKVALGEKVVLPTKKIMSYTSFPRLATYTTGILMGFVGLNKYLRREEIKKIVYFYNVGDRIQTSGSPEALLGWIIKTRNRRKCLAVSASLLQDVREIVVPIPIGIHRFCRPFLRMIKIILRKFIYLLRLKKLCADNCLKIM